MLKVNTEPNFFSQIVIATVDKWNILNDIKDQAQMIQLLDFFVTEPKIFSEIILQGENEENLLQILSRYDILSVLQNYLKESYKFKNIDKEQLKRFLQTTNNDGDSYLHLICSKPIVLSSLLETIKFLQQQFGLPLAIELMKATTKNGNNLLNLISKYQEPDFFLGMSKWLVKEHKEAAKNLIIHRNNEGLNNLQS